METFYRKKQEIRRISAEKDSSAEALSNSTRHPDIWAMLFDIAAYT